MKTMRFVNPISGKVESVPTLIIGHGHLMAMKFYLKKLEKDYNVTSVWIPHLNQDSLENFFGAFTIMLINNISSVHGQVYWSKL